MGNATLIGFLAGSAWTSMEKCERLTDEASELRRIAPHFEPGGAWASHLEVLDRRAARAAGETVAFRAALRVALAASRD